MPEVTNLGADLLPVGVPADKLREKLKLAGEYTPTAITWGYQQFIRPEATDTSRALHVGDLVVRAFGSLSGDGRLILGAADQRSAASTSSPLVRLNVPGSGLQGVFGKNGNGKAKGKQGEEADRRHSRCGHARSRWPR